MLKSGPARCKGVSFLDRWCTSVSMSIVEDTLYAPDIGDIILVDNYNGRDFSTALSLLRLIFLTFSTLTFKLPSLGKFFGLGLSNMLCSSIFRRNPRLEAARILCITCKELSYICRATSFICIISASSIDLSDFSSIRAKDSSDSSLFTEISTVLSLAFLSSYIWCIYCSNYWMLCFPLRMSLYSGMAYRSSSSNMLLSDCDAMILLRFGDESCVAVYPYGTII